MPDDVRLTRAQPVPSAHRPFRISLHSRSARRCRRPRRLARLACRAAVSPARRVLHVLLSRPRTADCRPRRPRPTCCRPPTAPCSSRERRPLMLRRQARGNRSASFSRRWTCTSTACRRPGRVTRVVLTRGRFLPGVSPRRGDRQRAQRDLDRPRGTDRRRPADRRHPRAPRGVPASRRAKPFRQASASAS